MGDGANKTFQLGAAGIDSDAVSIKALNSTGSFDTLIENTDFTVDRVNGKFTLNTARATPVAGEDNLYVTYAKTIEGYADRIGKCDICTIYGINGLGTRSFPSGVTFLLQNCTAASNVNADNIWIRNHNRFPCQAQPANAHTENA